MNLGESGTNQWRPTVVVPGGSWPLAL